MAKMVRFISPLRSWTSATAKSERRANTQTAFLLNPWWNNGAATIGSISIQGGGDFSIDSRDTTCEPHSELAGSAR